jgi:F0F1-type ATP synthase assembly protein I
MDTEFLTSNRFIALIIGSASVVLIDPNFGSQPWYISLGKFLGLVGAGFISIRTVDRFGEQTGGNRQSTDQASTK